MKNKLTPAERLIVAADFQPDVVNHPNARSYLTAGFFRNQVRNQALILADKLKGTGVYLKVNSALRACGYELIDEIHHRGLKVFADLKLFDIGKTLSTDGILLREAQPELLTVVCGTGSAAIMALKEQLPSTEVLGVTVLTSLNAMDTQMIHGGDVPSSVQKLAECGIRSGVDGFICSSKEVGLIKSVAGDQVTINTPGIRPTWAIVRGDDQNPERIMTPAMAIKVGATRIVVGRPILDSGKPYDAVMRTIEEISLAL